MKIKETASIASLLDDLETVFLHALAHVGSMHPEEAEATRALIIRAQRDVPLWLRRMQHARNKTLAAARKSDPSLDALLTKHQTLATAARALGVPASALWQRVENAARLHAEGTES